MLIGAVATALVATARGDVETREPVRLSYTAPAGCPGGEQFSAEFFARTRRARAAPLDENARQLSAAISVVGSTTRGALTIVELDGTVARREVSGETCAEVVSALALVAALSIEPSARAKPAGPVASSGALPPLPEPAHVPETAPSPQLAPESPAHPPQGNPQSVSPPSGVVADPHRRATQRVGWFVGVEGRLMAGLVPDVGLGAGAFAEVASRSVLPLSPSFRLTPFLVWSDPDFESPYGASVRWLAARADVCPVRPSVAPPLRLALCLGADAGVLRTEGRGPDREEDQQTGWFAAAAVARLDWRAARRFGFEAGVGLDVPLRQYRFVVYEDSAVAQVFRLRPVSALVTLGIKGGRP